MSVDASMLRALAATILKRPTQRADSVFARAIGPLLDIYDAACVARDRSQAIEDAIVAAAAVRLGIREALDPKNDLTRAIEVARDASIEADNALYEIVDRVRRTSPNTQTDDEFQRMFRLPVGNGCGCDFCTGVKRYDDNWCTRCAEIKMPPPKWWEDMDVCDKCEAEMDREEAAGRIAAPRGWHSWADPKDPWFQFLEGFVRLADCICSGMTSAEQWHEVWGTRRPASAGATGCSGFPEQTADAEGR